jgi:two-component system chemotaxis response regulator CheB
MSKRHGPVKLIAIATSTGGPAALHRILIELPRDFGVPIVVVQHMAHGSSKAWPAGLRQCGAARLSRRRSASHSSPGTVYIAPDDAASRGDVGRARGAVQQRSVYRAFDPPRTFSSTPAVARTALASLRRFSPGWDGTASKGCATVKARGGRVIAQDEQSSIRVRQ